MTYEELMREYENIQLEINRLKRRAENVVALIETQMCRCGHIKVRHSILANKSKHGEHTIGEAPCFDCVCQIFVPNEETVR